MNLTINKYVKTIHYARSKKSFIKLLENLHSNAERLTSEYNGNYGIIYYSDDNYYYKVWHDDNIGIFTQIDIYNK